MDSTRNDLFEAVVSDANELAVLGKALAQKELASALKPFARMIACGVTAAVLGFAGMIDLIKLIVAVAIGGDVGVSRPWLGWSAFTLLVLAGLVGYFGTRRAAVKPAGAFLETRSSPA